MIDMLHRQRETWEKILMLFRFLPVTRNHCVSSEPAVFSYFMELFFYSISSCSSQFSIPFFIAVEIFMDFSVWRDSKLLFCLLFEKLMSSRNASQSQFVSAGAHRSKNLAQFFIWSLEMGNRAITSTRSIKNSNETRLGNSWRCGAQNFCIQFVACFCWSVEANWGLFAAKQISRRNSKQLRIVYG